MRSFECVSAPPLCSKFKPSSPAAKLPRLRGGELRSPEEERRKGLFARGCQCLNRIVSHLYDVYDDHDDKGYEHDGLLEQLDAHAQVDDVLTGHARRYSPGRHLK